MNDDYNIFRIAVCGDMAVGKSILCKRLAGLEQPDDYVSTNGVDLVVKYIDNAKTKLHFWDLAGSKKFDHISKKYIEGVDMILYVYNIQNIKSLKRVKSLYRNYRDSETGRSSIIIGTHIHNSDIDNKDDIGLLKYGKSLAADINAPHIIISSKTGKGVENLLDVMNDMLEYSKVEKEDVPKRKLSNWEVYGFTKCIIM